MITSRYDLFSLLVAFDISNYYTLYFFFSLLPLSFLPLTANLPSTFPYPSLNTSLLTFCNSSIGVTYIPKEEEDNK
ncbi:hypothetical protein BDV29DRAFT_165463 [Aspergillus leporis]|jgi:hypothetical protein|uniref:Uncharacterized protein n=1 Tax=Aspergillus leporis TaxID=41062 RepID=A0A5N5XHF4_9EURO|nr:hypothetical protein BDV29DRAFT_165463 [Aspergillus leporis]